MRSIFLVLALAVLLSNPRMALAELDDLHLGNLTKRAWGCGNVSQAIKALQIEEHYPKFKERFLKFSESRGASGWEIDALSVVFEGGVRNAIEQGIVSSEDITEEDRELAIGDFDTRIHKCLGR